MNQPGGILAPLLSGHNKPSKTNQLDVAAEEFQEILRLDPHNAAARASLGAIAFNQRDYPEAVKEFQESLRLKPDLVNAQAFLGMSEMRVGDFDEAKRLFWRSPSNTCKRRNFAPSVVRTWSVFIKYISGELDKAAVIVVVLESLEPNKPDTLYTAYRVHSDLAARALATLVTVAPESARTHEILAQSLMSRNEFSGAVQEYRRAVEIDPNLPEIHLELGQALLSYSASEASRAEAEKEFQVALARQSRRCEFRI